ncbi:hypothetical protein LOTGIDRAFT_239260 [Lottia gigantea]|uniref:SOCS box domain-containing protein n=1 Tax=Lottia gigantea TaxID=225164 RepID=V4AI95_LOTGI|nr:hypothetical protein LOTGIDRAFT_239260 [Lottia gigantea]ESO96662.1 hypothetical protein LOTGIDRAFT_239260 [Lottia gigantea]
MLIKDLSISLEIFSMADYRDIRDEIEEHEKPQQLLSQYEKKLVQSIQKCQLKAFHRVLASGIDPNYCYEHDKYPLHYSTQSKPAIESDEIFETLLYSGADLDVTDRFGTTPLHMAVTTSSQRVISLIEAGCAIDAQDNAGMTALMKACGCESPESLVIVQVLIDSGCNVYIKDESHYTAVHHIILNNKQDNCIRKEILYQLIYSGLSPSEPDKQGNMTVHMELLRHLNPSGQLKEDDFLVLQTLVRLGRNIPSLNKFCTIWIKKILPRASKSFLIRLFGIFQPVLGLTGLHQLHKLYSESSNCDQKLIDIVKEYSHNPRTLKSTCRYMIRSVLKERLLLVKDELPLPAVLKNYLLVQ